MKTVQKIKEVKTEEVISGNDMMDGSVKLSVALIFSVLCQISVAGWHSELM